MNPDAPLLVRLDPRLKIVAVVAFTLVVGLASGPLGPGAGLLAALALLIFSGLSPSGVLRRFLAVNLFVAFLWVFLPLELTWDGGGIGLAVRPGGLHLAALVTLKVNAIFLAFTALLNSTSTGALLHGLAHLRLPAKLVTLFMLFFRYVDLIQTEYHRLRQSMRVRCFTPRTDLHTYRSYANLLGMLLVRSYERSERVYQAMLCRGFNGTYWILDHFAWGRADSAFAWAFGLLLAGLAFLGWWGPQWS